MCLFKNMHLFEGDILLSREQQQALNEDSNRQARAVVRMEWKKWPNGTVPYELSSQFSKHYTSMGGKYVINQLIVPIINVK